MHHRTRSHLMIGAAVVAMAAAPRAVHATVHTVTASGKFFLPSQITVARGDTVRWVWADGIHSVTNGSGSSDPQAGEIFSAPLDIAHPTFQYRFLYSGDVPYFCAPHEFLGMSGVVHVTPGAFTFQVRVLAFSFSPDQLDIERGDTVLWQRVTGTHTVTSGFGPADPGSAGLFRGSLNQFGGPHTFSYTFGDTLGTYPYYCELHVVEGMDGRVHVITPGAASSVDPKTTLMSWGWLKRHQYGHPHDHGGH